MHLACCHGSGKRIFSTATNHQGKPILIPLINTKTAYLSSFHGNCVAIISVLQANYGKANVENAETCKQVFLELRIPELYRSHVDELYKRIESRLEGMPPPLARIFLHFLNFCKRIDTDFAMV